MVISGPSAVGKTSVASEILSRADNHFVRIVTCTTRAMRTGEVDGQDYYFMTKGQFLSHEKNGDFVEHSEVYGNYYGVLISTIKEKIDYGEHALLVINWEGHQKIKKIFSENVIGFFLIPPSMNDLEKRIRSRGTDSEEIIKKRMDAIAEDMRHKNEFDFCVENREISEAADEILRLIRQKLR